MKTPDERADTVIESIWPGDPFSGPWKQAVAQAIREAVDAAAPRWIPVGERLPDTLLPVLVWIDGDDMDVCYLEGGRWTTGDGRRYQDGAVTHWMPYLSGPAS